MMVWIDKKFVFHILAFVLRIAVLLLCNFAAADQPVQLQPSEYEIKAAFIYNFAKFVEWPPESEQAARDSIIIGILGQDPFGSLMEQVIGGKTAHGKTISIERYQSLEQARHCHILFISDSKLSRLSHIIEQLADKHILTVGEMETFAREGGMIYLYVQEKRIRFKINMDAANAAQLKLSSKLLKLAEIVRNTE
ncbi:YfiR family protein [bacterium]|nr:YfiR family protein [bacterium]